MKRLTKKIDNGRFVTTDAEARSYGETDPEDGFFYNYFTGEAVDKLAAYEDTGLTPEEIEYNKKALELFAARPGGDRVLEIAKAEQEGRLVVLPCKVGDTVYQKDSFGNVYEGIVRCVVIEGNRTLFFTNAVITNGIGFYEASVGKTVFLTRAEAEKAMEGVTDDA